MDRSSLVRILVIALLVVAGYHYLGPSVGLGPKRDATQPIPAETYANAPGFVPDDVDRPKDGEPVAAPTEGTLCHIKGDRYDATLSTRGADLVHFFLRDPQYAGTEGMDLVSTNGHPPRPIERWRSLRTLFRGPKGETQLKYDRFNWTLSSSSETSCTFTYADDDVKIEKVVAAGSRPFELNVSTTLTNLSDAPRSHDFSVEIFAFRTNKEVKGGYGRQSPLATELSCARGNEIKRKTKDDFKEGWFSEPLVDRYVALSNPYFTQALMPMSAPDGVKPACDLLAEDWYGASQKRDDDDAGAVYHARLEYPAKELQPKESATYTEISYFGPKERSVLAKAGGGTAHLGDVIYLGFFSPVAKVLVGVLVFFHGHVAMGNWGLSIITMTICLRLLLLPLSIKPVRTSIAMRKLKPEIDALSLKYKDDAQAKNMATMELYRKHGVNPLGGCLPQLVQMPIWFAMYTTLQTAVEMYHEHFLWFSDLSAPDHLYILPLLIGGLMVVQQKIVPQQGMDPMQAKMMMYMMPIMFTGMMIFLPAALGVYMLTNSLLGITQQLVIERIAPRGGPKPDGEITVKHVSKDDDGPLGGTFGKGKARV